MNSTKPSVPNERLIPCKGLIRPRLGASAPRCSRNPVCTITAAPPAIAAAKMTAIAGVLARATISAKELASRLLFRPESRKNAIMPDAIRRSISGARKTNISATVARPAKVATSRDTGTRPLSLACSRCLDVAASVRSSADDPSSAMAHPFPGSEPMKMRTASCQTTIIVPDVIASKAIPTAIWPGIDMK